MIVADLTFNLERSEVVDFSITLYTARRTLIALSNKNRKEIQTIWPIIVLMEENVFHYSLTLTSLEIFHD